MTKQDFLQEQQANIVAALNELQNLKNKDPLQLSDFKTLCSILSGSTMEGATDEQVFNMCKGILGLSEGSYAQFNALEETEKSKKLKQGIQYAEELFNQLASSVTDSVFPSARCAYSFTRDPHGDFNFVVQAVYDIAKPWYEQKGEYIFDNTESPSPNTIKRITLSIGKIPPNKYGANITITKNQAGDPEYKGDNDQYHPHDDTSITATLKKEGDPDIIVTISGITVSSDRTMSTQVQIDGGTAQPYTLKFQGYFFTR